VTSTRQQDGCLECFLGCGGEEGVLSEFGRVAYWSTRPAMRDWEQVILGKAQAGRRSTGFSGPRIRALSGSENCMRGDGKVQSALRG
jgi:hypothetical protein